MPVEKSYVIMGAEVIDVVVSSATTNGQFSVLTEIVQPHFGPPPHVHQFEDEFFTPIYGSFEMFDGDGWHPLTADGHHCPRGKVHTFRNAGDEPGKLMVMATGGSFDVFLEKLVPLELPRDMQQMIDISAEHGITYVLDAVAVPEAELALA